VTRYHRDPRVSGYGEDGYTVLRDDGTNYQILPTDVFGWTICHGPNLDFVPTADGGFAIGYPTADDAIADLLEPPATTTETSTASADTGDDCDGM
jgi:hypothetical protein